LVAVYKALGGGWETDALVKVGEQPGNTKKTTQKD
jgi:hypothetical protein